MLGLVVFGSRTWMCTMAAPALAASMHDCAICAGLTGTAGFLLGESAEPVTAQEIITLRCMSDRSLTARGAGHNRLLAAACHPLCTALSQGPSRPWGESELR